VSGDQRSARKSLVSVDLVILDSQSDHSWLHLEFGPGRFGSFGSFVLMHAIQLLHYPVVCYIFTQ
jgi:hypothetical protein